LVTIGVFTLFHPRQLIVRTSGTGALSISCGEEHFSLEKSFGLSAMHVTLNGDGVLVTDGVHSAKCRRVFVTDRQNGAVDFELVVPSRIKRKYHGTLEIRSIGSGLLAVISMDLETAVASVVAAEVTAETPVEAMKAQAVAARSYFVAARGRHRGFDFCDTTHCQFLREVPAANSTAMKATNATRGLVLAYESRPFAAMYTRSCNGTTQTPAQVQLPAGAYPYFSVACSYCRSHPAHWSSKVPVRDAAGLHSGDEPSRLALVRRLGWDTVPSNSFVTKTEATYVVLEGVGQGHGVGLCQAGANAMAREGAEFRQILLHYYPNTEIQQLGDSAGR
jgi:stage II sporulation protein D (peptidoglycan lytic transglycosylase)